MSAIRRSDTPSLPAPGLHRCWISGLAWLLLVSSLAVGLTGLAPASDRRSLLAWTLLIAGLARSILCLRLRSWTGSRLEFRSALVTILISGLLLAGPVETGPDPALLLGTVMLVCGLLRCIMAFDLQPARGWSGVLFGGVLGCLLGLLLLFGWTGPGVETLILYVAAQLLIDGIATLPLARLVDGSPAAPAAGCRDDGRDSEGSAKGCRSPEAVSSSERS